MGQFTKGDGVRYRIRERVGQPVHADDWLITYADMITLLLCFFVVFIVMTAAKKEGLRSVAPILQSEPAPPQIQLPDVFENNRPFRKIDSIDTLVANMEPVEIEPAVASSDMPPAPPEVAVAPQSLDEALAGDRIKTIELNSAAFFDSGAAVLTIAGKTLLSSVLRDLRAKEYSDYRIAVEGHTDDTPIHTAIFPSNWELSTARAAAVVHFFLDQGIPAQKLRAAGYADTFPKAPNRDASGKPLPKNQAQNRRVIIKLEKIEKAQ